jgi:hypothetical protein
VRGYGGDSSRKSLSMGFSWSKDRDAEDGAAWPRGATASD